MHLYFTYRLINEYKMLSSGISRNGITVVLSIVSLVCVCSTVQSDGQNRYNPETSFTQFLLSLSAYSHNPQLCLNKLLASSDFEVIDFIGRKCNEIVPTVIFEELCFAYTAVSHKHKAIVVSYRGTNGTAQLVDEALTILLKSMKPFVAGGEVQEYFLSAHNKLYGCVQESVRGLVKSYPSYDVWVTGYSLGAAIASLCSLNLVYDNVVPAHRMILYGFGMPRVGNRDYAMAYDKVLSNSWRVVHSEDCIPRLPFKNGNDGPYHHQAEIYYNETMLPNSSYITCQGNNDTRCNHCENNKCLNIKTCAKYHSSYFGIRKKICYSSTNGLRDENGPFHKSSRLFISDKCSRIPMKLVLAKQAKLLSFSSGVIIAVVCSSFLVIIAIVIIAIIVGVIVTGIVIKTRIKISYNRV